MKPANVILFPLRVAFGFVGVVAREICREEFDDYQKAIEIQRKANDKLSDVVEQQAELIQKQGSKIESLLANKGAYPEDEVTG